jgi:dUTP pyrophosphatase
MQIHIKHLDPDSKLPIYAHPGDVGLDVFSKEDKTLTPGERYNFMLGFALEFPHGYAGIMKDKGSMARNHGCHVMGGVYDAGYRGEYNVELINLSGQEVQIAKDQKIAQLVIFPVAIGELVEVDELSDSERGEGRFGSTGKF